MQVKTTNSQQIWQSPDGKRTIWDVTLKTADGSDYKLKTYSPEIARLGYSGEVRSYLNPRGDRFVRQVSAAQTAGAGQSGGGSRSSYQRDDNAIKAQWAIGQAINLASVKMDKEAITMPVIEKYARELYATVSRVKGEPVSAADEAEAEQYIKGLTQTAAAF
ncbi:MAG TPA: hypothetical protein VF572_00245 [Candidatus Saccharimonadales bacterium]|jgi:hypothetical protein